MALLLVQLNHLITQAWIQVAAESEIRDQASEIRSDQTELAGSQDFASLQAIGGRSDDQRSEIRSRQDIRQLNQDSKK
jgi:hypothetical protein